MASSSGNRQHRFAHGSVTELVCYQASAVILMNYDERQTLRLLGLGHFAAYVVTQIACPILAAVCSVDGFQWPLTKDTVVFRMAKRTFAFLLPGLMYGLQFPKFCDEAVIDSLERVFTKYGNYYQGFDSRGLGYILDDTEPFLWYKLRPRFEPLAHQLLRRLGQLPGRSRFWVSNHGDSNQGYLRAVRMSAATKLIADAAVSSGTLTNAHIEITGTHPLRNRPGAQREIAAHASVSVFCCLVDSVEAASVIGSGLGRLIRDAEPPLRTCFPSIAFKVWKLNEQGLLALIHRLGPATEREQKIMKQKDDTWEAREKAKEEAAAKAKEKEQAKAASASNSANTTASAAAAAADSGSVTANDKGKHVEP